MPGLEGLSPVTLCHCCEPLLAGWTEGASHLRDDNETGQEQDNNNGDNNKDWKDNGDGGRRRTIGTGGERQMERLDNAGLRDDYPPPLHDNGHRRSTHNRCCEQLLAEWKRGATGMGPRE